MNGITPLDLDSLNRLQDDFTFAPTTTYRDNNEWMTDTRSPRYQRDERFRQLVQEKLSRSRHIWNPAAEPVRPPTAEELAAREAANPHLKGTDLRSIREIAADSRPAEFGERQKDNPHLGEGESIADLYARGVRAGDIKDREDDRLIKR
jgi:hypothetical protein